MESREVWTRSCSSTLSQKPLRLWIFAAVLVLLVFAVPGSYPPQHLREKYFGGRNTVSTPSGTRDASIDQSQPRYMRLIVPGNEANQGLCKTLFSSSALGYPSPTIINWGKTFDDKQLLFGGSHVAKLEGVLNHLKSLDPSHDDDLVMIVDGLDVWFQLRPSTLIERYFRITSEATRIMQADIGSVAVANDITQKVIFSSQKKCWPKEARHPACYAVPESALPKDAYGNLTDNDIGEADDPAHFFKWRQRWLNSGSCIGPVSAVRKIFERAKEKEEQDQNFGSDQSIFAEIFGEQEFQRHVLKYHGRSAISKAKDWASKKLGRPYSYQIIENQGGSENILMPFESEDPLAWEFGITLDYRSQIMQATVFSEYDTQWVSRADRKHIETLSSDKGIPLEPPRVGPLPTDITKSLQPFYSPRHGHHGHDWLPVRKTWNEVPLFTNLWTGISPAAVHHNAHRGDLKGRIKRHWPRTWFQRHLRALLNLRALSPQRPVAVTHSNASDPTQGTAWYSHMTHSWMNEFAGATTAEGEFLPYDRLCIDDDLWKEVFRDDKGPWWDPRLRERPPKGGEEKG